MTFDRRAMLLALNPLDAPSLLAAFGTLGILAVLFAETGLLVGFFLPGDSLLFTAGVLCSTASTAGVQFALPWVLLAACAGAVLGAQTGFLIGRRMGASLSERAGRPRIRQAMTRAQGLLERYGYRRAIVLARFIPVVRTVLNPVAGAVGVPARLFTTWQVIGGVVWTVGLVLAGYALGNAIPDVDNYLLPVVAVIVVVSLVPLVAELLRARSRHD
jgi:membrane-associated protein